MKTTTFCFFVGAMCSLRNFCLCLKLDIIELNYYRMQNYHIRKNPDMLNGVQQTNFALKAKTKNYFATNNAHLYINELFFWSYMLFHSLLPDFNDRIFESYYIEKQPLTQLLDLEVLQSKNWQHIWMEVRKGSKSTLVFYFSLTWWSRNI